MPFNFKFYDNWKTYILWSFVSKKLEPWTSKTPFLKCFNIILTARPFFDSIIVTEALEPGFVKLENLFWVKVLAKIEVNTQKMFCAYNVDPNRCLVKI